MDWNAVQKSLRQFAGINLDKNRTIPPNWVVVKEEIVTGDKGNFIVRMGVFPETFSGFPKGKDNKPQGVTWVQVTRISESKLKFKI